MTQDNKTKPEFKTFEDSAKVREMVGRLEPKETMIECRVPDGAFGAGRVDRIKRFEKHEKLQVRPWFGGAPDWMDEDEIVKRLVGAQIRLTDYEPI